MIIFKYIICQSCKLFSLKYIDLCGTLNKINILEPFFNMYSTIPMSVETEGYGEWIPIRSFLYTLCILPIIEKIK